MLSVNIRPEIPSTRLINLTRDDINSKNRTFLTNATVTRSSPLDDEHFFTMDFRNYSNQIVTSAHQSFGDRCGMSNSFAFNDMESRRMREGLQTYRGEVLPFGNTTDMSLYRRTLVADVFTTNGGQCVNVVNGNIATVQSSSSSFQNDTSIGSVLQISPTLSHSGLGSCGNPRGVVTLASAPSLMTENRVKLEDQSTMYNAILDPVTTALVLLDLFGTSADTGHFDFTRASDSDLSRFNAGQITSANSYFKDCLENLQIHGEDALRELDADELVNHGLQAVTEMEVDNCEVQKRRSKSRSTDDAMVACKASRLDNGNGNDEVCQICGDISSGFHCGAYVCEACKKFFVRCLKQECGQKFHCPHNKDCAVTKQTRTQCQYCRLQKCLRLGMYKPCGTNVSAEISIIPCNVCGAPSSGFHFGAITCEGCKGFFRRTIKERDSLKYHCSHDADCSITANMRNVCKFCRYQKCLKIGMSPEGSRIGRQPNSVKHATLLQLNEIKRRKGQREIPLSQPTMKIERPPAEPDRQTSMPALSSLSPLSVSGLSSPHRIPPSRSWSDGAETEALRLSPEDHKALATDLPFDWMPNSPLAVQTHCVSVSAAVPSFDENLRLSWNSGGTEPGQGYGDGEVGGGGQSSSRGRPIVFGDVEETATIRKTVAENQNGRRRSREEEESVVGILGDVASSEACTSESTIRCIQEAYKELEPITRRCEDLPTKLRADMTMLEVWKYTMLQFQYCALATVKFAKKVPGFRQLPMNVKVATLQSTMYPIVLTVMSTKYDLVNRRHFHFALDPDETEILFSAFEPFRLLTHGFTVLGQLVRGLGFDEIELALLCGLLLMADTKDHQDSTPWEDLTEALRYYCGRKTADERCIDRTGLILLRLGELAKANLVHRKVVTMIHGDQEHFGQLAFPQLFQETFLDE